MATTGTAELTNSLQEILTVEAQYEAARTQVFGQFPMIPADGAISGPDAGQTVRLRFLPRLPIKTDTINEKADITPRSVGDEKVDVTINEYGDAVQITKFAEIVTKGDLRSETSRRVAEQMVASLDRLAGRQYYEGNTFVFRANGVANRSDLDSTNDIMADSGVGTSFLERGSTALRSSRTPGFREDSTGVEFYSTVIHPVLRPDMVETAGYLPALQYQNGRDELFNGELGDIRGLRIMVSEQGKVYPGAGNTAQSATTLNGAVTEGATSIIVTSATGFAVGDIITIGTLEDGSTVTSETSANTTESVLITAVNGTTLTVAGLGYASSGIDTPGLRYDHANAESVVEADTVAAIPIFGPQSVMKAYATEVGEFGMAKVTGPFDVLERFLNIAWYAVMGWNATTGLWTARLEVATSQPHLVYNE